MYLISVTYRTGSTQQLACESLDHARRGWMAISDAMEEKRAVVVIENPDSATTFSVGEIASCSFGVAVAPPQVEAAARAAWAN